MQRVREQCGAQRSTEAIAQPAARRPERSEGHAQKKNYTQQSLLLHGNEIIVK
ncbi:MAG: hypothetical protein NZ455_10445 [Bacteroidia bacterium]|nr:hypothetical protein [Bacteroidia bacterium]MDW8346225.1 hypothetical protein [Bacteroidia bacterium]